MSAGRVGVRRVRRGRSPNCSATGAVVGTALLTVAAAGVVVNAFADRLARWDERPSGEPPRVRSEGGHALLAWPLPAAILTIDPATAEAAARAGAQVIEARAAPEGAASAPLEVHVAVTGRCPASCETCYLDAGPGSDAGVPLDGVLEELASMGVFEVAFGGGEGLLREDLLDLGRRARALGMVPNLTTSGFGLTEARARELALVFGQVNVSLDGLGETYRAIRGWDGAALGLAAIDHLVRAGVRVGVNSVIARPNLAELPAIGRALAARGVAEWQWLRLKPQGRGTSAWERLAPTTEELLGLWPAALAIEAETGLVLRWDCAMVPFLAAHRVPVEALEALAVEGCPGGRSLLARGVDGRWTPCSFAEGGAAGSAAATWDEGAQLRGWRERAARPPEPCASCEWAGVCGGGCRIVAAHLAGDPMAPDPQCPKVIACG